MSKLFLIPGLGADTRIYKHIDLIGYDVVNINWIDPNPTDTLTSYAKTLIRHYHIDEGSVVIGNSLGGMVAVEIAKTIELEKVILISSIKTVDEAPWYFRFFRTTQLHRLIPTKRLTSLEFAIEYAFGDMSEKDQQLFASMLRNTSPLFMKWAINAILKWNNHILPKNVYHITGDKDRVFDHKRMKGVDIIKGGTHIMIFNKADEINIWLKKILQN